MRGNTLMRAELRFRLQGRYISGRPGALARRLVPPARIPRLGRAPTTRTMASPVTGTTSPLANPLAIHIPSLDNTYGALLLGTFFGLMCVLNCVFRSPIVLSAQIYRLYGLSLHQGFQYMRIHWGDLRSLKLYVSVSAFILANPRTDLCLR